MTVLDPEMEALAIRASVPLRIKNPMRFVAEGPDFIRGLAKTVDEAATLQRESKVVQGFALEIWAAFLLAAGIGYDGYIVSSLGEMVAEFLRQPRAERNEKELVSIGEALGIRTPEAFLHGRREDNAAELWELAYDNATYHLRPVGLKLAFWAVCIRASELDFSATHVPESVAKAALIYRAFASGS